MSDRPIIVFIPIVLNFLKISIRRDWVLFGIHSFFYTAFLIASCLYYALVSSSFFSNQNEELLIRLLLLTSGLAIVKMQYAWVARYKNELGSLETLGFTRQRLVFQYSMSAMLAAVFALISSLIFLGFYPFPQDFKPLRFALVWIAALFISISISLSALLLYALVSRHDPMTLLRKDM